MSGPIEKRKENTKKGPEVQYKRQAYLLGPKVTRQREVNSVKQRGMQRLSRNDKEGGRGVCAPEE